MHVSELRQKWWRLKDVLFLAGQRRIHYGVLSTCSCTPRCAITACERIFKQKGNCIDKYNLGDR